MGSRAPFSERSNSAKAEFDCRGGLIHGSTQRTRPAQGEKANPLVLEQWLREVRGRPLAWMALSLASGLASGIQIFALAFLPLWIFLAKGKARWVCALFALYGIVMAPKLPVDVRNGWTEYQGNATVVGAPRPDARGERAIIETEGQRWMLQYNPEYVFLALGDRIFVRGRVGPFSENSVEYWRYQGVSAQCRATSIRTLGRGNPFAEYGQVVRRSFIQYTARELPKLHSSIVNGLCFNHDVAIEPDLKEKLRKSGTIHIISTSGLHVVLLAAAISILLKWVPLPRWAQLMILFLCLIIFAAASGFRPPMVRSVAMVLPAIVAYLFRRESDGVSLVAFSALVTMFWMPNSIWDIGFQLSFVAVLGLVLFVRMTPVKNSTAVGLLWARANDVFRSSLVATLASAPLLAFHFGRVSWLGCFSNLLIAPAVPVVTCAALGAWLIAPVAPWLSHVIMQAVVGPLAGWLVFIVQMFGSIPIAEIPVARFSGWLLVPIYFLGASLWRPEKKTPEDEGLAF